MTHDEPAGASRPRVEAEGLHRLAHDLHVLTRMLEIFLPLFAQVFVLSALSAVS